MITVELPQAIISIYRPATSYEIQSWSFGAVTRLREDGRAFDSLGTGTLDDEAIFGPRVDYCCACEKVRGKHNEGMICDLCGVCITSSDSRRERFGHVNIVAMIYDHVSGVASPIESWPVLPAAYRESAAGAALNELYEQLVDSEQRIVVDEVCGRIILQLTPLVSEAVLWNLREAPVLARGIGLVRRY